MSRSGPRNTGSRRKRRENALRAALAVAVLASACALPLPWIELGGDPETLALALRWEACCLGDPIAGCERLVAPAGAGQLVALSAAIGPLTRLNIDAGEVHAEDGADDRSQDPEEPDLEIGPGGVDVHVGWDAEDLLGPADPEDRSLERSFRASQVRERRRVLFLSERRLALRSREGVGDVRRYPLAALRTQERRERRERLAAARSCAGAGGGPPTHDGGASAA